MALHRWRAVVPCLTGSIALACFARGACIHTMLPTKIEGAE
jgi:hypothetical protein